MFLSPVIFSVCVSLLFYFAFCFFFSLCLSSFSIHPEMKSVSIVSVDLAVIYFFPLRACVEYFTAGIHPCLFAQLCPTLCDPVDCSMPGFLVFHCIPEFAQLYCGQKCLLVSSWFCPSCFCCSSAMCPLHFWTRAEEVPLMCHILDCGKGKREMDVMWWLLNLLSGLRHFCSPFFGYEASHTKCLT